MAANQTINNNLIREILDKEKLNGSKFLDWCRNLRIVLMNEQKLHHLEEALPEAPPTTVTVVATPTPVGLLNNKKYLELKTIFQQQAEQELFETVKVFHACKQEEGQSVSTYDYDQFMQNYNIYGMGKTIPELHAMLKLVEKSIPKKAPAVLAIRHAIKAIESFDLTLPSEMVLVLDNCHFAPSNTRWVISLSRLWDNGFLYEFMDNGAISVSKNNLFYFNAIPRDGIFEIDMQNHISNERSIYTCSNKKSKHNLDCTFLWYCRLGHINKKRIVKLQHDGLLESTDDESFDVCISCIYVIMARKPFTHASERDDDLLGLIHSDVCGLFRTTSRECANYYVTFTDDFSRYGYVYLMKHKHEVFEMFKTFQNEVENQLKKTIKALRLDRRGKYLSQEFLDHLRSCGIISKLTRPYTPQHNGVSERRNQTLLDMVQSMMSLTTLPMSFWGYALESATRILNMVPTKKSNLISQEASGSIVDFDEIQRQDEQPSDNTSEHQPKDEYDDVDPQTDVNPVRRSARIPREPERYGFYIDAEEHELAMNTKMQSMKDNQVWTLVDLPPDCKTVGSKWLFKKKTDMDGNIHTYKARLVEKGFTQTYGVNYEETFSPVANIKAIRILIAIAAYYDYKIWKWMSKPPS
ncbi:retrotransposon protein, putative, ty1-copia subclass [Tanacetum coccineum]